MIKDEIVQKILCEYDEKHSAYEAFTLKQRHLISELLQERSFSPHSITSRVKGRQSLCDKLRRPDSEYATLSDITDVSGVRITTYFSDEIDRVASFLDEEFEIIKEHSIDKRKMLDADRFGYLSLHYVVKLSQQRLKLTEYRRFPNLVCEIQVRSILQHAWAEIEHDLGYKTRIAIPQLVRRRFSRLAGLLELADEEFVAIRDTLDQYRAKLPEEIAESPTEVTLDKLSLLTFLQSNQTVAKLDKQIATFFGATDKLQPTDRQIEDDLHALDLLGIRTIADLNEALDQNADSVLKFAKLWIGSSKDSSFVIGICFLYLFYVLVARSGKFDFVLQFLDEFKLDHSDKRVALANKVLETYASLQK